MKSFIVTIIIFTFLCYVSSESKELRKTEKNVQVQKPEPREKFKQKTEPEPETEKIFL